TALDTRIGSSLPDNSTKGHDPAAGHDPSPSDADPSKGGGTDTGYNDYLSVMSELRASLVGKFDDPAKDPSQHDPLNNLLGSSRPSAADLAASIGIHNYTDPMQHQDQSGDPFDKAKEQTDKLEQQKAAE